MFQLIVQGEAQATNQPLGGQGRPAPPEEMEEPRERGHQHDGRGGKQEVGQQGMLRKALGEGPQRGRSRGQIPGQGHVDGEGAQEGHQQ